MEEEEEDTVSLILRGCKLAKDLEISLPYITNQPTLISESCERIVAIFSAAKQRIDRRPPDPAGRCLPPSCLDEQQVQTPTRIWKQLLRSGDGTRSGSVSAGALTQRRDIGIDVAETPPTPSRRHRRRRNDGEDRWTVKISAPRIGDMEVAPDDGYTWRKYGQKEILGSKFPRGYFRCTHRKLYQCHAKKQVQRLDNDPSTFEVTYRHLHTCHMYSTAPLVPPPTSFPQDSTHVIATVPSQSQPPLTTTPGSSTVWMPVTFDACGPSITRSMNVVGDVPGPSAGVEAECQFASTIGDMVFNHGVGHKSAVEFMFTYMEERWKGRVREKN